MKAKSLFGEENRLKELIKINRSLSNKPEGADMFICSPLVRKNINRQ